MSQVDIQTDTEGRIIGLSGNFTKWTNSNGEEDHFAPDAVTITVPENMEAHVSASMTVDDWGYIDITPLSGSGSTIRAINLTTEVASPGPRGGHVRWSGQTNAAIVLQPGQYSIIIRQDNAPYGEAYASEAGTNVSFCQASVTIEYIAILAPAKTLTVLTADEYGEIGVTGTACAGYIKSGDRVSNGKHAISVGLEYSGPANDADFDDVPTSSIVSDNFKPSNIVPDSLGKARFKVWTMGNTGDPSVVSLNCATSEPISYLPAVFEDKFEVTVYYTCMESSFSGENANDFVCYIGDSNTNTVILSGVNANFKNQVVTEGFGLLTTPVVYNGITYPYLAKIDAKWRVYEHVLGNASNELVPKVSCATDGDVIKRGSRIQILLGDELLSSLENEQGIFVSDDTGHAINGNHIDLYWGCDAPSPNDPNIPAGLAQGIASGNHFRVVLLSEN